MTIYGYVRVSTDAQNLALQVDALTAAGVELENIIQETASGAGPRPLLEALLERLVDGDTLVVWKIDRIGRSAVGAIANAERLRSTGVRLVVTTLGLDTTTPAGRLVFAMLAQIAEFEREQIIERTRAGLAAAKRRGAPIGRPKSLTQHQRSEAARMVGDGQSYGEVAAILGVAKSIVWRAVNPAGQNPPL